jgi:hypothetical protein
VASAFDETDLRPDRRAEPRLRLVEEDLPRQRHLPRLLRRRRRCLGLCRHRVFHAGVVREFLRGLAPPAFELALRVALGIEFENRAVGGAAARQTGSGDRSGTRPVELGRQRALRIGHDRLDRAGARPDAEPVQRQCRRFCITGHRCRP